jgi:serine/threonine-protein kinase RsbW
VGHVAGTAAVEREAASQSLWLLRYVRSYPGTQDQVQRARTSLREFLAGCPRVDDAVALASEFAANAVLHSRSGVPGGLFTVRAEVSEGAYVWAAVQDDGGVWKAHACQVQCGHGLDIVQAIAGQGNWGVSSNTGGRLAWARLVWPGTERLERNLNTAEARLTFDFEDDGGRSDLERLAAQLITRDFQVQLITSPNRLCRLEVSGTGVPLPPQRIYAQADWFFWPHAERIAACDDLMTAADAITRALQMDSITQRLSRMVTRQEPSHD